jgi:Bacterial regulatory proteins, luxR family
VAIDLRPLSLGALRSMLGRHVESISRPALRRIHETSGGNPLYALELARGLADRGESPEAWARLRLPAQVAAERPAEPAEQVQDPAAAEIVVARISQRPLQHSLAVLEVEIHPLRKRLVAQGRKNREIGQALFMSVATVEAHLTRIYRKLDLRARSELARLIAEGAIDVLDDGAEV